MTNMADKILVWGTPVGGDDPVDPGYGHGHPLPPYAKPPIHIPPAPPIINPPPVPPWGVQLPEEPDGPIVIPQPPDKPKPPDPPNTIWPPPDNLPSPTKGWVLVYIIGSGGKKTHWLWVDWTKPVEPPPAQPK